MLRSHEERRAHLVELAILVLLHNMLTQQDRHDPTHFQLCSARHGLAEARRRALLRSHDASLGATPWEAFQKPTRCALPATTSPDDAAPRAYARRCPAASHLTSSHQLVGKVRTVVTAGCAAFQARAVNRRAGAVDALGHHCPRSIQDAREHQAVFQPDNGAATRSV